MTYPNHIIIAIRDALELLKTIDTGDDVVEFNTAVDPRYDGQTANLTIATSDGCHFKVAVTRDE